MQKSTVANSAALLQHFQIFAVFPHWKQHDQKKWEPSNHFLQSEADKLTWLPFEQSRSSVTLDNLITFNSHQILTVVYLKHPMKWALSFLENCYGASSVGYFVIKKSNQLNNQKSFKNLAYSFVLPINLISTSMYSDPLLSDVLSSPRNVSWLLTWIV